MHQLSRWFIIQVHFRAIIESSVSMSGKRKTSEFGKCRTNSSIKSHDVWEKLHSCCRSGWSDITSDITRCKASVELILKMIWAWRLVYLADNTIQCVKCKDCSLQIHPTMKTILFIIILPSAFSFLNDIFSICVIYRNKTGNHMDFSKNKSHSSLCYNFSKEQGTM